MIKIIDLHKKFNGQEVLKGINLEIPKGEVTVIMGPSGEGKTVLLKHIIGLIRAERGRVMVEGTDLNTLTDAALNQFRRKFGMLFQNGALFDSLNVEENVSFPLREHTKLSAPEIRNKVLEKLRLVGLEKVEGKMPSELSGGMRKRVGLARAIALEPEIILYDEPTTGLDPLMTRAINGLILDMQKKLKMTTIIISHDVESTFAVADRVAMLKQGKIIAQGTPEEIRKSELPFVQEFIH